ncbi:formin-like protein 5 isoform X2 [Asparagus officinalis]|uniref:formin-like protein 5 isoform X2 n=1 Tax=Asparagus officinalis TaxID=4686 RepID=UPI00098E01DB|nr:formin-like protein 5 isoform X2 [Asparagus officinalis]
MALLRRFFNRKPPDRLLEITERVYVFDCCFSKYTLKEDEYEDYMDGIVIQLQNHLPDASFMVFNFLEGDHQSKISFIFAKYNITVMDYPWQHEAWPLLPMEMIYHCLRSSESWLSLQGQHNVLLMHCERGGWPILAFMLAGLLLYRKQLSGEQNTLEMIYKQAPNELLHVASPLNPQPSHLRYLQYITRHDSALDWLPGGKQFRLDCLILRIVPPFDGEGGCWPVVRVYGQDPVTTADRTSKILFSTPKTKKHIRCYRQEESATVKVNTHCQIQGDVVIECIHMDDTLEREDIMFRVMFNTAFVQSNVLVLNLDDIDVVWSAKDQLPKDFKVEVVFSDKNAIDYDTTMDVVIGDECKAEDSSVTEEFFEAAEVFSNADSQSDADIYSPVGSACLRPSSPVVDPAQPPSPMNQEKSTESNLDPTPIPPLQHQGNFYQGPSSPSPPPVSSGLDTSGSNPLPSPSTQPPAPSPPPEVTSIVQSPSPPPPHPSSGAHESVLTPSPPPSSPSPGGQSGSPTLSSPPPPPIPVGGQCVTPPPPPPPSLRDRAGPPIPPPHLGPRAPTPPALPKAGGPPLPPPLAGGGGRGLAHPTGPTFSAPPRKLSVKLLHWVKVARPAQGSLWAELQNFNDPPSASYYDVSELESLFPANVPKPVGNSSLKGKSNGSKPEKVRLIDLKRAYNIEIMLANVKIPLPDMMSAVLALDDSILDVDQVENLIKFCPTKEEMDLLKFFLELMKVPQVESKLRVFSFKIQFRSQISDLRKNLNTAHSACVEIQNSVILKEFMKKILLLGNTLNQGTAKGSALGFRLESLLKLADTRAVNKLTLLHYFCKVLASKSPHLLDFYGDLISLEAASKIKLKFLAEEMQAVVKGLEKVELDLTASENDGPVSEVFCKTLREFTAVAVAEVQSLKSLYTAAGRRADALVLYFGEDPAHCTFEEVISILWNFVTIFRRAHQENCKQAELERKREEKEAETEKSKSQTHQIKRKRSRQIRVRCCRKQ